MAKLITKYKKILIASSLIALAFPAVEAIAATSSLYVYGGYNTSLGVSAQVTTILSSSCTAQANAANCSIERNTESPPAKPYDAITAYGVWHSATPWTITLKSSVILGWNTPSQSSGTSFSCHATCPITFIKKVSGTNGGSNSYNYSINYTSCTVSYKKGSACDLSSPITNAHTKSLFNWSHGFQYFEFNPAGPAPSSS